MSNLFTSKLCEGLLAAVAGGARTVGLLGFTPAAVELVDRLALSGLLKLVAGVFDGGPTVPLRVPVLPVSQLAEHRLDVLVVTDDQGKEELLLGALPYICGTPKVIIAGYGHLSFRDPQFAEITSDLLVPSLANGYPNSLIHLYQCLGNAARLGLAGTVAEFGMFKGGTTMFLAKAIKHLGTGWPVIGFDTFAGFPSRRSPLDMYDHPGCVFTDLDAVRRYCDGQGIEIVAGDVVDTAGRLDHEDLVLTFVDTDNYSSARAALDVVIRRTLIGGAIVFDHVTGTDRFCYTLGERLAAARLYDDPSWFHLHGTGVFYRQR